MLNMHKRSNQLELMDLGPTYYTQEEYKDCLHKLGVIGTMLGGDRATLSAFDKLATKPTSILDVGCGGGSFTRKLAEKYPNARVVGIDIDKQALVLSNQGKALPNLSFQHRTDPVLNEPDKSFDVVTGTLLCHHLTDDQIVQFLQIAKRVARQAIIINDLHRHPFAYALFWLISPFFRNRMIRHDGLLSIRRAFIRTELEEYMKRANFDEGTWNIQWAFPFRWIIRVDCHE